MRSMHFDGMVESKQRERDPYRRRRGSADFEDRESDDPYRQRYFQVDIVVNGVQLCGRVMARVRGESGRLAAVRARL